MDWISLRLLEHQTVLKTPFLALSSHFLSLSSLPALPYARMPKLMPPWPRRMYMLLKLILCFQIREIIHKTFAKSLCLVHSNPLILEILIIWKVVFFFFVVFLKKKLTFMLYMPLLWCKYPINIPLGTDWPSFHWRKSINCPHKKCK